MSLASVAALVGAVLLTTTHNNTGDSHSRNAVEDTTAANQRNVAAHTGHPADTHSGTATRATRQLAQLKHHQPGSMRDYNRDKFGDGWNSQGHGCTTRDAVLQKQGKHVNTSNNCTIKTGQWDSLYDGKTVTNPHKLDVDHLVPEAESWRSGAKRWSQDKREQFANDYRGGELVAVSRHANRSKGDAPPPGYMPIKPQRCSYAKQWIRVKTRWQLTITQQEHDALSHMLETCS